MAELLMGCGSNSIKKLRLNDEPEEWNGLVRADINPDHNPDIVVDFSKHPLPFNTDCFDSIHAYDVLEHLAYQGDFQFFFREWSEYWRILKNGGKFYGIVPRVGTAWAWGDPSHKRVLQPETFVFLQQEEYERQVGKTSISDFRNIYKANFKPIHLQYTGNSFCFILEAIK